MCRRANRAEEKILPALMVTILNNNWRASSRSKNDSELNQRLVWQDVRSSKVKSYWSHSDSIVEEKGHFKHIPENKDGSERKLQNLLPSKTVHDILKQFHDEIPGECGYSEYSRAQ